MIQPRKSLESGVVASMARRISPFRTVRADWLVRAARLPGRTLHYAMAVYLLASTSESGAVSPTTQVLARYGITPDAAGDALTRLVDAGLLRADRGRGREARLFLLEAGGEPLVIRGARS